jgi:hypothetical protein
MYWKPSPERTVALEEEQKKKMFLMFIIKTTMHKVRIMI